MEFGNEGGPAELILRQAQDDGLLIENYEYNTNNFT
jgi:hypothetical protein